MLLAVVFGLYAWAIAEGFAAEVIRTMTFIALVAGNVGLILVNRSRSTSAVGALLRRRNPALLVVVALATALLLGLVLIPPVRDALQLGFLSAGQWALAVGAGVLGVAWFEVVRWARRREPRQARARHLR